MKSPRSHLNAVALNGSVYVIGGLLRGGTTSAAFDRYDPTTDRWTDLPALPIGTDHSSAVGMNSSVFVFGGGFAQPSTRAFRFDIAANRWTSIAMLPEPRSAGGAAVVGSHIYVVGGFDTSRRLLASAHRYDPAADRWTRVADLPTPREHLAVTAFRGSVCGIGGHVGDGKPIRVTECYEPATNRWTTLPELPRAASDFDAAVAADAIWTVGDDVQVFDGTRWWFGPQLATPRFGIALASLASSLFAIGGVARTPAPDGMVERLDLP
jgi:N-acetylneuraminic acid mutarotase